MTVEGEVRPNVMIQIESMKSVQGRDKPQWEVECRWPWSSANARFPDRCWVDKDAMPSWTAETLGTQAVEVVARGLKKNRDGEYYDGTRDWMWQWAILGPGKQSATPAASTDSGRAHSQDDYRRSKEEMRWTEAVSMAVHLHGVAVDEEVRYAWLDDVAETLYSIIAAGPASPTEPPIAGPESDVEALEQDLKGITPQQAVINAMTSWNIAVENEEQDGAPITMRQIHGYVASGYNIEADTVAGALQQLDQPQAFELARLITAGEFHAARRGNA